MKRHRDRSMLLTMCTGRVLSNTWRYKWCLRTGFYLLFNICVWRITKNSHKSIQSIISSWNWTYMCWWLRALMKERFFIFNCNQWKRPVDRYLCTQNTQPLFSFYLSGVVEHRLDKAPAHNVSRSIFHFSLSQCLPFYRICCEGYPTNVCEWIFWYKSVFRCASIS